MVVKLQAKSDQLDIKISHILESLDMEIEVWFEGGPNLHNESGHEWNKNDDYDYYVNSHRNHVKIREYLIITIFIGELQRCC